MTKVTTYRRRYGQFFTPEPVVACCYGLLAGALPLHSRIADPACGEWCVSALRGHTLDRGARAHRRLRCRCGSGQRARDSGLPGVRHADGLDPASLPPPFSDLVIGNPPYGVFISNNGGSALTSEVRFLQRAIEAGAPRRLRGAGATEWHFWRTSGCVPFAPTCLAAARCSPSSRSHVLPRATGTSAACSILLLRNAPPAPEHHVFFALPAHLEELPEIVATYHSQLQIADCKLQIEIPQSAICNLQSAIPEVYWRPQTRPWRGVWTRTSGVQSCWRCWKGCRAPPAAPAWRADRPAAGLDCWRPCPSIAREAKGAGQPYEYYQTREFMAAGYNYAAIERCDERAYQRLRSSAVRQHDILVSCAGVGGAGQGRSAW